MGEKIKGRKELCVWPLSFFRERNKVQRAKDKISLLFPLSGIIKIIKINKINN